MQAVKTFDSTGIAPNGRVYATDLNAIQAAAAGLTDLAQTISLGSLVVGEAGLALSRVGAGEMQAAGGFRSTGILRGLGGIFAGQFTTTQRDAIGVGLAPTGLIVFNTTTNQFEWNSGTDGARVWKAVGFDASGDIILTGVTSSLDFTAQNAANPLLTSKRTGDTVQRLVIKEDGTIEIGPGGVTARDVTLARTGANILSLGAANKLILGSGGIQFSDGIILASLTDSILASMIAPNAIGASELADGAVDTAAIIDGAVTTLKLLDGNVTLAKLAAQSVDTTKIANSLKPSGGAAVGTEALRALGTSAGTAAAGDDGRFTSGPANAVAAAAADATAKANAAQANSIAVPATSIGGFGTPFHGKQGMLAVGASPYTHRLFTYDANIGKWVSDPWTSEFHRYGFSFNTTVATGYSDILKFVEDYSAHIAAGCRLQYRVLFLWCNYDFSQGVTWVDGIGMAAGGAAWSVGGPQLLNSGWVTLDNVMRYTAHCDIQPNAWRTLPSNWDGCNVVGARWAIQSNASPDVTTTAVNEMSIVARWVSA